MNFSNGFENILCKHKNFNSYYNSNFKSNYQHKTKNQNAEANNSSKKINLNDSFNLNKQQVDHIDQQSIDNESYNKQQVNNPLDQLKSKTSPFKEVWTEIQKLFNFIFQLKF